MSVFRKYLAKTAPAIAPYRPVLTGSSPAHFLPSVRGRPSVLTLVGRGGLNGKPHSEE